MNWDKVKHFSPSEFADDPKFVEPELICTADAFRGKLGERIFPSPVPGSLARHTGDPDSQHYVGPKDAPVRLSTAIDVFPEGIPIYAYSILLTVPKINGIGVYLDTTGGDGGAWVMFHLDIRKSGYAGQPLIWICEKVFDNRTRKRVNVYRYPQNDPQYWSLLRDPRMYRRKEFGKSVWPR